MPLPERQLIAQLRRTVKGLPRAHRKASVICGIGDDCAVLRAAPGLDWLVTTDFSLEGMHFRRDWHPAESVGHRCLTRGLSDIAAMGGTPLAAFLSLAVPKQLPQSWITSFTRGLLRLATRYGVTLAGGDTAESPNGVLADIVVLGTVPKGKAILRSGARPGDRIFVSGVLGESTAALERLGRGKKTAARGYERHFFPQPRIDLGCLLRERRIATAMIDTSDGLSTDLSHICEESRVGAEIDSMRIPCAQVGKAARKVVLERALHGGEDYELLFTVSPQTAVPPKLAGVRLTEIGRIKRGRQILVRDENGSARKLEPHGWEHFGHEHVARAPRPRFG